MNRKLYLGNCHLNDDQKIIIKKNPHCTEFFCNIKNITDCSNCKNFLRKRVKFNNEKLLKDNHKENFKFCKKKCNKGFFYDILLDGNNKVDKCDIDKFKVMDNFKNDNLIYKYDEIPYKIKYEKTYNKPKTVVHWGQMKLFLETLLLLINKVDVEDKEVHIIYAGSSSGDNILLLIKMFPNTIWYLIDPRPHNRFLHNNPQVKKIISDYFTDELAQQFHDDFKDRNYKLLFISDIRDRNDNENENDFILDNNIIADQLNQTNWHKIIQPDYSYFKFRCPYEIKNNMYTHYKGTIYVQPFAPPASTESRILFEKQLEECDYDIEEYQGKFLYFNRVLRPSYYTKSIIKNNEYFDHCYDCTYYSYLIKNYLKKFHKFNPFDTEDITEIMIIIMNKIVKLSKYRNKLIINNSILKRNLL